MILLLSFDGDRNTNRLIDWLHYFGQSFKRIHLNDEDFQKLNIKLTNGEAKFQLKLSNGEIVDFNEFPAIYNRGVGFQKAKNPNDTALPTKLFNYYLDQEFDSITSCFYNYINSKSFGNFRLTKHYKLNQLIIAQKNGFKIPKSLITNNVETLLNEYPKRNLITKAVQDNIALEFNGKHYLQTVQAIAPEDCPSSFFSSLFQEKIDKTLEIRSFYLDGNFYSLSCKTFSEQVDLKDNYDNTEYSAYKLPLEIENKLKCIMNELNLISGSIDLLLTNTGDFFFLEVNPNGQYDWVSQYGDYNLHKIIAEHLINKLNNANKEK